MNFQANQYASIFSTKLSSAYNQLRGDLGAPQTAADTIGKLVERIQTSPEVEDRRTAVLGLKGLSRDWKEDVGSTAIESLLAVLEHDAPHDVDSAKAVLETFMQLCEVPEKPARDDPGLRFTDVFLSTPGPFHSLLNILSTSPSFYPRFYTLQFLSQLLHSRPTVAQSYIMSAPPPGLEGILSILDTRAPPPSAIPGSGAAGAAAGGGGAGGMGGGAREMLRNEALLLLPVMVAGNADFQKIVAFSGAFEKLFEIIDKEGGIDGGIVVQDTLTAVGSLLRYNVSNQNYFRELALIPVIPPILGFPAGLAADVLSPDDYCLQYWPEQKIYNTGLVLGLIRMLIGGPGGPNQSSMASSNVTRSLVELSLSSNAPNSIKSQSLNTLTPILLSSGANQDLLSSLQLSPLVPVPADDANPNGGFVREGARAAVITLVNSVVEGDAAGGKSLRGRAAGVNMFEAYVTGNDDARLDLLSSLTPSSTPSAGSTILSGLLELPTSPTTPFDPYRPLFACLLLAHLLRSSEHAKKVAREILLAPPGADEDEEKVSLIQLVVGNLMLASREQTEAVNRSAKDGARPEGSIGMDEEDWTRVIVGYLVLLCTWLWDSPRSVKEFLAESANLQILIQPITQTTGMDPLVQGLSAFLLGVCYEFNREPGEITRATLHPILHSRIGPDQFVSRMARLREDPRFRAVQPDAFDTDGTAAEMPSAVAPVTDNSEGGEGGEHVEEEEGLELWFDWAFVDFWKNHYYTIQRSIAIEPDAVRGSGPSSSDEGETASIIMSLRQKLKAQTDEVIQLQSRLSKINDEHKTEKGKISTEVQSLTEQLSTLSTSLSTSESAQKEQSDKLESLRSELESERIKSASTSILSSDLEKVQADLRTTKELLSNMESRAMAAESRLKEMEERVEGAEKEARESFIRAQSAEVALESARSAAAGGGGKKSKKGSGGTGDDDVVSNKRVKELEVELESVKGKMSENEKEHEDLLVLLEEMSEKRKKDRERIKSLGGEVSEDEDDDDDEEEEEEEAEQGEKEEEEKEKVLVEDEKVEEKVEEKIVEPESPVPEVKETKKGKGKGKGGKS